MASKGGAEGKEEAKMLVGDEDGGDEGDERRDGDMDPTPTNTGRPRLQGQGGCTCRGGCACMGGCCERQGRG